MTKTTLTAMTKMNDDPSSSMDLEMAELSEYERKRLERIRKNEEYLKSLGLGSGMMFSSPVQRRSKSSSSSPRPRPRLVSPGQERRSKRLKKIYGRTQNKNKNKNKTKAKSNDSDDKDDEGLVMLSYNTDKNHDEMLVVVSQNSRGHEISDNEDNEGNTYTVRRSSRRVISFSSSDEFTLSREEKEALSRNMDDNYLHKFEEFLVFHNKVSEQNVRNVMRQVGKLARGEGIRYESPRYGWPKGCYFLKGTPVTPLSDIVQLMIEAQQAEDRWGRDHGNGWLLSHPLKKLLLFQQFCLQNPDFLTAKCKLKEYYDAMHVDEEEGEADVPKSGDLAGTKSKKRARNH